MNGESLTINHKMIHGK